MTSERRGRSGERKGESRLQEAAARQSEHRAPPSDSALDPAPCDVCGVQALVWQKCKLVCRNCGAINKTCADL
jgi:hypothetical protein